MDAILLQILNGLDKGAAYALIALGLTLIFGTLGVVNFAHGALFAIGAFCAVTMKNLLSLEKVTLSETEKTAWGTPVEIRSSYTELWFGPEMGAWMSDWAVPLSILLTIPVMLFVGWAIERGLIKHFYKRPHADQILVTFGLAIVLQEIIKIFFGANNISMGAPEALRGTVDIGIWLGFAENAIVYNLWRLVYFLFAALIIGGVFAFLQFTTFGMVVRAGMADRETVGLLGIDIDKKFTFTFAIAAVVAGLAGAMYTAVTPPIYDMGMELLVLSFVVVVVGGMGSLPGAVLAGFLLGILESLSAHEVVKQYLGSLDQIIVYLVAIIVLLVLPRGLMGRKGVMEE